LIKPKEVMEMEEWWDEEDDDEEDDFDW